MTKLKKQVYFREAKVPAPVRNHQTIALPKPLVQLLTNEAHLRHMSLQKFTELLLSTLMSDPQLLNEAVRVLVEKWLCPGGGTV